MQKKKTARQRGRERETASVKKTHEVILPERENDYLEDSSL